MEGKKIKNILKYPFHKIRDIIRYFKISSELKNLTRQFTKENSNVTLFLITDHFGEVYVACCFLKYLKSFNQELNVLILEEQKYTMQLTNIFPYISKTYCISRRASDFLIANNSVAKKFNIELLHIYERPFNLVKPKNMVDAFKFLLNRSENLPSNVTWNTEHELNKIQSMFSKMSCKLTKTILLAPEAKSFESQMLNYDFWIQLAEHLVENGYDVIFNSKQQYEKYHSIFLPIGETILFAKLCGYVVGLRSGLLDVVAGETNVFIQAIYPKESDIIQSRYEHLARFDFPQNITTAEKLQIFYSLKHIRDDDKITEITLKSQTEKELIKYIIDTLINKSN